jgi:hypothetical protein
VPDLLDKPESKLQLTADELAAIKRRLRRCASNLRRWGDAAVVDAEAIRRIWHEHFGNCRLLTEDRFDAFCHRRDEGFTATDICWAVKEYLHECSTDPWRAQRPRAHKTFERFIWPGIALVSTGHGEDRFEDYLAARKREQDKIDRRRAEEARLRTLRERAESERRKVLEEIAAARVALERFHALPAGRQQSLLDRAWDQLNSGGSFQIGQKSIANHLLRQKAIRLMLAEEVPA